LLIKNIKLSDGVSMNFVAILVMLQGGLYILDSIIRIFEGANFKIGGNIILSTNFYFIGIIFGAIFIISSIGLLKKRKYGYFLALYLYAILIIYYLMAIAYLIINQQYFLAFYCIAVMVVFYMIINYVRKNKSEFTK
jgi:Ca2+/Na+ antiporter